MDGSYIKNQFNIFYDLYKKNLVYRDLKPVYWSPSSKTALAEAELEYDKNYKSPSLLLRFRMLQCPKSAQLANLNNLYALIWTTTPWSLPANQALSFNPEFEYSIVQLENHNKDYYVIATSLIPELTVNVTSVLQAFSGHELNGCSYYHPIEKQTVLPLLPAKHVQSTKGTGLVHTAPSHGPDDYIVSLEHKIDVVYFFNFHLISYSIDDLF